MQYAPMIFYVSLAPENTSNFMHAIKYKVHVQPLIVVVYGDRIFRLWVEDIFKGNSYY